MDGWKGGRKDDGSSPLPLLIVNMRTLRGAKPIPNPALGLEPQEKVVDAIHHPARVHALPGLRVAQLEREVDRAAARAVRKLDALLLALAHGAAVLERLPGVALERVGQAAVVVRIVLLVGGHVVPGGHVGRDLAEGKLVEDVAVAKQDVVLRLVSVSAFQE